MKNARLIVDGKEIEILLDEENLEKLTYNRKTGYERASCGSHYFTDRHGEVESYKEAEDWTVNYKDAERMYKSGDYYSDPGVAANNVRADKLMKQLRRFAVENRKVDLDWDDSHQIKYYLLYSYTKKKIDIGASFSWRYPGQIYFDTREAAELALKTYRYELLWYFTDYHDSL